MDRLNYFAPYQSKTEYHEDQLTRAFLVVLKYVPFAQAAFIEAVRMKMGEARNLLPSYLSGPVCMERIETQVGKVPTEGVTDLVSIMMTDKNWTKELVVDKRETSARYDGVIQFGPVALTIENKPCSKDIWEAQVSPALENDTNINIYKKAVVLYWPEILSSLASLLTRGILGPSATELIRDFFAFVQDNFPLLNPYDSLEICGENPDLIELRCKDILGQIAPAQRKIHGKLRYCLVMKSGAVREVYLVFDPERKAISLGLYPGDTMNQARDFYCGVDIENLLSLPESGWQLSPNLHFSFIQRHYYWSEAEITIKDYLTYWYNHQDRIAQVNREEGQGFTRYFQELHGLKMITKEDFRKLDEIFNQSNRNHIRPCPGLALHYLWPFDEAVALDRQKIFGELVREKLKEAFNIWGQALTPMR